MDHPAVAIGEPGAAGGAGTLLPACAAEAKAAAAWRRPGVGRLPLTIGSERPPSRAKVRFGGQAETGRGGARRPEGRHGPPRAWNRSPSVVQEQDSSLPLLRSALPRGATEGKLLPGARRSTGGPEPSKLEMRVRFPLGAPRGSLVKAGSRRFPSPESRVQVLHGPPAFAPLEVRFGGVNPGPEVEAEETPPCQGGANGCDSRRDRQSPVV